MVTDLPYIICLGINWKPTHRIDLAINILICRKLYEVWAENDNKHQ
jgi:hypothetical protein